MLQVWGDICNVLLEYGTQVRHISDIKEQMPRRGLVVSAPGQTKPWDGFWLNALLDTGSTGNCISYQKAVVVGAEVTTNDNHRSGVKHCGGGDLDMVGTCSLWAELEHPAGDMPHTQLQLHCVVIRDLPEEFILSGGSLKKLGLLPRDWPGPTNEELSRPTSRVFQLYGTDEPGDQQSRGQQHPPAGHQVGGEQGPGPDEQGQHPLDYQQAESYTPQSVFTPLLHPEAPGGVLGGAWNWEPSGAPGSRGAPRASSGGAGHPLAGAPAQHHRHPQEVAQEEGAEQQITHPAEMEQPRQHEAASHPLPPPGGGGGRAPRAGGARAGPHPAGQQGAGALAQHLHHHHPQEATREGGAEQQVTQPAELGLEQAGLLRTERPSPSTHEAASHPITPPGTRSGWTPRAGDVRAGLRPAGRQGQHHHPPQDGEGAEQGGARPPREAQPRVPEEERVVREGPGQRLRLQAELLQAEQHPAPQQASTLHPTRQPPSQPSRPKDLTPHTKPFPYNYVERKGRCGVWRLKPGEGEQDQLTSNRGTTSDTVTERVGAFSPAGSGTEGTTALRYSAPPCDGASVITSCTDTITDKMGNVGLESTEPAGRAATGPNSTPEWREQGEQVAEGRSYPAPAEGRRGIEPAEGERATDGPLPPPRHRAAAPRSSPPPPQAPAASQSGGSRWSS